MCQPVEVDTVFWLLRRMWAYGVKDDGQVCVARAVLVHRNIVALPQPPLVSTTEKKNTSP